MHAEGVDPRDCLGEDDHPVYRVYFWDRVGTRCDEWWLTEATDVHEVIAWAEGRVPAGDSYVLYVERPREDGVELLRLAGVDPAAGGDGETVTVSF